MSGYNGFRTDGGVSIFITGSNSYMLSGELAAKRTYVDEVVREIFEKDIRRRVKIKDIASFEVVRNFIINSFGVTTSINSLHQALRKNGISIGRSSVSRYIKR